MSTVSITADEHSFVSLIAFLPERNLFFSGFCFRDLGLFFVVGFFPHHNVS